MRTKEAIRVVCDGPGCGRVGDGFREMRQLDTPQGPAVLARIVPPQGWKVARVVPELRLPPGQQVDPFAPANEVARAVGPLEAAFCPKCQGKIEFTPPAVEAPTDPDPRQAERDAEKARAEAEAEAEAEAAERAAFEAKRAQSATGGV